MESHPGHRHLRVARAGRRTGRAALAPARVGLHRSARLARRLRDTGPALHGREPANPALLVPVAPQRRPRLGRLSKGLAGAGLAVAGPDGHLSVGLGAEVPHGGTTPTRHGYLPGVPGRCRCHARTTGADITRARCAGERQRSDGDVGHPQRGNAARLRALPCRGARLRCQRDVAVRVPPGHRSRPDDVGHRRAPLAAPRARRRCHAGRLRRLAEHDLLERRVADNARLACRLRRPLRTGGTGRESPGRAGGRRRGGKRAGGAGPAVRRDRSRGDRARYSSARPALRRSLRAAHPARRRRRLAAKRVDLLRGCLLRHRGRSGLVGQAPHARSPRLGAGRVHVVRAGRSHGTAGDAVDRSSVGARLR